MNSINYLKQAKLADALGKYRLADTFYQKAVRLAAPIPPPFVPIAEAGARAAAETALREALVSGEERAIREALIRYGFTEDGIKAIEEKIGKLKDLPQNVNINTLIGGAEGRVIEIAPSSIFFNKEIVHLGKMNITELKNFLRINASDLTANQINKVLKALRTKLNNRANLDVTVEQDIVDLGLEERYLRPRPRPTPRPESPSETPGPSETSLPEGEVGEGLVEKIKNRFRRKPSEELTDLPKQKSKVMKWAKILGAAGLAALGLYFYKDKLVDKNGKEINYFDIDLNKIGLPDDTMYKARMEAGQQQTQEPKALEFIEKNKNNKAIKDQRDWYNLALQNGDKNFANDVVAIIKKSDPTTQGFDAKRNA